MSALLSATCILFLFWTITHLVRRLLIDNWDELTTTKTIAIEASGLVGALIYTFSDTFWFSAVEGEVYAYSSAFTAVVFWMILKWEDNADSPHSDRWLVLITYMTGLSIGVHLLNLLCIPAIVLVYYYKRYPDADLKGSLIALAISVVIVAAVLYGVVPGIITVGGWFELFFVNTLGMPFNTGEIIYIALLVGVVVWAIYESYVDKSFKKLFFSHELRLLKPDPRIYLTAIRESGREAGECLFIDDSPRNVDGAIAVGMHAVLYRPGTDNLRTLITDTLKQLNG